MAVTTEALIVLAKEAADLTNVVDYVTDATWVSWLDAGVKELHRFVTNKFKATYFRTSDFTLSGATYQQTLPTNFWRLKALDLDADTIRRRAVLPYNFAERNRYQRDYLRDFGPTVFCPDRYYNVVGSSLLQIQPQEHATGNYRLYYTPKPKALALARSITVTNTDAVVASTRTWTFANGAFSAVEAGNTFTLAGTDNVNDGTYTVESRSSSTTVVTVESPAANETFDGTETLSLSTCLDAELEPYAEYPWLCAAIKSLVKEESYQQAKFLADQRNLIREDLTEALETDAGGPKTVIDTDEWDE